jgi:hypothetical protein
MSHRFVGDFCIFCGAENESAPCKEPTSYAEQVIYETKYWMAEHGWDGVGDVRWHEITTHIAGCLYGALRAVRNGADQVTFMWPGGAKTYYIEDFMIPGILSGLLKEGGYKKITIEIVPNRKIRTDWLVATILHQERMGMKFHQPLSLTAQAIASKLKRRPYVAHVSVG